MIKYLSILTLAIWSLAVSSAAAQQLSPGVSAAFNRGETPDVLIIFKERADLSAAAAIHGKEQKAQWVFDRLSTVAGNSQAQVRAWLKDRQAFANSYYIVNAIAVSHCSRELAAGLLTFPEIEQIVADPWVSAGLPRAESATSLAERSAVEWGIERILAPQVWSMGYTGQGITVGGADTGYEWWHPAIKPHYRGYYAPTDTASHHYNWHDAIHEASPLSGSPDNPCGYNIGAPCDDNSHGTHTMGTMTGDDGQGNQIGVAPGAKWVACRNMERGNGKPSSYIECFEWFLAPTDLNNQNPNPAKAPHVINNSWYCNEAEGCTDIGVNDLIRQALSALKASGVFVVVSNGNFGSGCNTTTYAPGYFEESFSVGAIQPNDTIAGFSSRGPVTADGSFRIKPNVSAPGQSVRSCVPNGNYAAFSGTSMSGPHVAGLVALILSANPDLAGEVETVENLIEQTCTPRTGHQDCSDNAGTAYPNNTYGYGTVNALAAVNKALELSDAPEPVTANPTIQVAPNPVTDRAVFSISGKTGHGFLYVFGLDGRLISQYPVAPAVGDSRIEILVTHLQSGTYFWRISTENISRGGTFIKN